MTGAAPSPSQLRTFPQDAAVVVFPAPVIPADVLLSSHGDSLSFFWETPLRHMAGRGVAYSIAGHGERRFKRVISQSADLWKRLSVHKHPEVAPTLGPVMFGGGAFAPGLSRGLASALGDALFVLPEAGYITDGRHAAEWIVTTEPTTADETIQTMSHPFSPGYQSGHPAPLSAGFAVPERLLDLTTGASDLDSWVQAVRVALRDIASGSLEKVVLARRHTARLPILATPASLARALGRPSEGETRFLFHPRPGVSVIGKSPERLVSLHDQWVETEAVAGTCRCDQSPDQLTSSPKDCWEHQLVISGLVASLDLLCDAIDVQNEPTVRATGSVQHLVTTLRAKISRPRHVLSFVETIHPSPALCGSPRKAAFALIERLESHPRGWYGGPVGWMDSQGNGEFSVMIRSAFLAGGLAEFFAGAGIVAGSVPRAEYDETEAKFAAMRRVLCPPEE